MEHCNNNKTLYKFTKIKIIKLIIQCTTQLVAVVNLKTKIICMAARKCSKFYSSLLSN